MAGKCVRVESIARRCKGFQTPTFGSIHPWLARSAQIQGLRSFRTHARRVDDASGGWGLFISLVISSSVAVFFASDIRRRSQDGTGIGLLAFHNSRPDQQLANRPLAVLPAFGGRS